MAPADASRIFRSRTLAALAAALLAAPALAQEQAAALPADQLPAAAAGKEKDEVESIIVQGSRGALTLHDFVLDFVLDLGDPATPSNGYARWQGPVCVSVENLQRAPAQYIADRISQVALDMGLDPGEPGCRPDIFVVFAADGQALAAKLVKERRGMFRPYGGAGGTTQGLAALEEFRTSDAAVRWWQITMVVDELGHIAIWTPEFGAPMIAGPPGGSRLSAAVKDELLATYIIVDARKASGRSWAQLADYLAMVALAQIDPGGSAAGYDSILNLFDSEAPPPRMTAWDETYLHALYDVDLMKTPRVQRSELVSQIVRGLSRTAATPPPR